MTTAALRPVQSENKREVKALVSILARDNLLCFRGFTEGSDDLSRFFISSSGVSTTKADTRGKNSVVRTTTEGWQNNRVQLESIVLNQVSCSECFGLACSDGMCVIGSTVQAIHPFEACLPSHWGFTFRR